MAVLRVPLRDDGGRDCGVLWLDHSRHDKEHTSDVPMKGISCGVLEPINDFPPNSHDQIQYARPPITHIRHDLKGTRYMDGATFLSQCSDDMIPVWIVDVPVTDAGVELDKTIRESAGDAKKIAGGVMTGAGIAVIGAGMAAALRQDAANRPVSRRGFFGTVAAGIGTMLAGNVAWSLGVEEEKQPLKDAQASERLYQRRGVITGDDEDHQTIVSSNRREQSPVVELRSAVNAAKIRALAKHLKDNPDAWADFIPYGAEGKFESMYALYGAGHTDIARFVEHPDEIERVLDKWKDMLPEVLQTEYLHEFTCFRPTPESILRGRDWRKKSIQLEVPEFAAIGFPLPEKPKKLSVDTIAPSKPAEKRVLEKNR
ncbi:MAG: hypothetical protein ABH834_04020 [Candidatus Altiarchaeota archaeon]